ncbi:MAG TPA: ankyrin repeat domain-containing protein, partial [Opitutales bacterium]|nr:ankyrin repeat domain-containing protein [Opitutales bacterium]
MLAATRELNYIREHLFAMAQGYEAPDPQWLKAMEDLCRAGEISNIDHLSDDQKTRLANGASLLNILTNNENQTPLDCLKAQLFAMAENPHLIRPDLLAAQNYLCSAQILDQLPKTQAELIRQSAPLWAVLTNQAGQTPLDILSARTNQLEACAALLGIDRAKNTHTTVRSIVTQEIINRSDAAHLRAQSGQSAHDLSVLELLYLSSRFNPLGAYDEQSRSQSSLSMAAESGDLDRLKKILDTIPNTAEQTQKFNVLTPRSSASNQTPLHLAAYKGHTEAIAALLNAMPNDETRIQALSIQNTSGETPLHLAVYNSHTEAIAALLNALPNDETRIQALSIQNTSGETPLHSATVHMQDRAMTALLNALTHDESRIQALAIGDANNEIPLNIAVYRKRPTIITAALETFTNSNSKL